MLQIILAALAMAITSIGTATVVLTTTSSAVQHVGEVQDVSEQLGRLQQAFNLIADGTDPAEAVLAAGIKTVDVTTPTGTLKGIALVFGETGCTSAAQASEGAVYEAPEGLLSTQGVTLNPGSTACFKNGANSVFVQLLPAAEQLPSDV